MSRLESAVEGGDQGAMLSTGDEGIDLQIHGLKGVVESCTIHAPVHFPAHGGASIGHL